MCRVCPLRRCRRASHESRSKVFAAKVQDARYIVGRAGRGSNHTQLALGARALVTQKRYGGDHNKGASVSVVRISPKASCSLRRRKRRRIWCCMPCPVAGATLRRRQRRRICDGSAAESSLRCTRVVARRTRLARAPQSAQASCLTKATTRRHRLRHREPARLYRWLRPCPRQKSLPR